VDLQIGNQTITVDEEASNNVELEGIDFITSGNQYLTFILGDEHYGVDILSVKEIRGWENPTLIPNSADYVKGVINMRGVIVPILDLRIRFDVGELTYDATTVVIVLSMESSERSCTMGFVVDAVSDVLNAEQNEIRPAPPFHGNIQPEYIEGLVNVGGNVVTLIHVDQLLNLEDEGAVCV
jgi:purine-binding chemotaxis protein CheW